MYAKFSMIIVAWMLSGGAIIYDGWDIFGTPPEVGPTGLALKSDARMTRQHGKSTLDIREF